MWAYRDPESRWDPAPFRGFTIVLTSILSITPSMYTANKSGDNTAYNLNFQDLEVERYDNITFIHSNLRSNKHLIRNALL